MKKLGVISLLALLSSFVVQADPVKYRVVMPDEIERFLVNEVFQTHEMKWAALTPGNSVYDTVQRAKRRPLFTMPLPADSAAVSNHPAMYGVLIVRPYEAKFVGDLYHLHELTHITTLTYEPDSNFQDWARKLIANEKAASLYTEALVYFEFPQWRRLFPLEQIWVDRFLDSRDALAHSSDNQSLYRKDPAAFKALLMERFVGIGERSFGALDALERRSWIYDRWNTVFTQTYAPHYEMIETQMFNFSRNWRANPADFVEAQSKWLERHTSPGGVLFVEPSREFLSYHGVLDTLAQNKNLADVAGGISLDALWLSELVDADIGVEANPMVRTLLEAFGVTTTVYSVPYPETQDATTRVWGGEISGLMGPTIVERSAATAARAASTTFELLFSRPHTKRQDVMHQTFLSQYRQWSKPVVSGLDGFPHAYPTGGSIEAMKDTLGMLKGRNPGISLHLFEGEYEGAIAIANALSIRVVKHTRGEATAKILDAIQPGDYFYITQPSSLDGNLWNPRGVDGGYQGFMRSLADHNVPAIVDLAYVGVVAKPYLIDVSFPNIQFVLFSLSKAFGVYYQRIGGVFSREPHPMLLGQKWFKNLPGIMVGSKLMSTHGVYELPRKYQWAQDEAVLRLVERTRLPFRKSDVILLAHTPLNAVAPTELVGNLEAFNAVMRRGQLRPALSPMIEVMADGVKTQRALCELYFRTPDARQS